MPVDARRLLRAGLLSLAVFLFVGGGVGFAVAAGEDEELRVPEPRPGDRATYKVSKQLLPEVPLGGWNDLMLDEVVYEWLPERTVLDRAFAERLSHPLQVTYHFRWDGGEATYVKVADHDAATGEPFHTSSSGEYTSQPLLLPGVVGHVGGGVDPLLQEPTKVRYAGDYYAWQMAVPCAQRSALHGAGELPATVQLGACGWPAVHDPTFRPAGWEDLPGAGRAFRLQADESPLLAAWYASGSPFPVRFAAPMREIIEPSWTLGRLFTLERTAWARGEAEYPAREAPPAAAAPAGNPVPLVPLRGPWMLDDTGLGGDLPLPVAYAEAERAPRTSSGQGTGGLLGTGPQQPSVREWMAEHPGAYLAQASRFESTDRYGNAYPGWSFLWVDGPAWLGKAVFLESSAGDASVLYLPDAAPKRLRVSDWRPYDASAMADFVARLPHRGQLADALPHAAEVAARFLAVQDRQPAITSYGFRWGCAGPTCGGAAATVWAGGATSTFDPNTGATGGHATLDSLTVDGDGLALQLYHQTRDAQPVLGLGAPSPEETPPAESARAGAVWALPASPAAATAGIGVLALLTGALYYLWPALKGVPGLPLAGLFSRLREDRLLEHPVRRRIHEAVQAEPGVHFQELARRVAVGNGALDHHVRKLVAAGLVTVRKAPGYTCYFPRATDRRLMDAAPSLRSGGSRLVLDAVAQRPGASSRDLASRLGLAPSTVSYHLKRLETAGLVLPGEQAGVRLTPLGEQARAAAA